MKSLFGLVLLASHLMGQTSGSWRSVDWKKEQAEVLAHYRSLIRIDTSNPPGNETKAVEYLKKVLEGAGIPTQTFSNDPSRANLVARISGNGSKRPLLIMAHTDVVGVQREKWPVDPFGAVIQDGYVWGRGSIDDKDKLTANLMTMLLLKRHQAQLDRDVIFLAEAGEEGTTQVGITFMVEKHLEAINAEFAITEGGGAVIRDGKVVFMNIGCTEKVPRATRLVVNGTSGHGSVPREDNALVHLSAALAKVGTWETPMRLNDTTRAYFERLAGISTPEAAARYNGLLDPAKSDTSQAYLRKNEPNRYSMLRTSVVPTIIKGGFRVNVIPSEAEATLDVRALPDEDMAKFYDEMRKVIGDPAVKIEAIPGNMRPAGKPSRLDTDLFRALEATAKKMYPGVTVLPTMSTGASDMAQLRAAGIPSYGIGPANLESDSLKYGAHSDVERLAEASLYRFVEFVWSAVTDVAGSK
ncbi:MAG TPA: M20/M25/M40 family metallo-hydrolase [Bryobacteraceae bacterium]|nr:M20/M25/M40 family metallo-hydrolase [Bryobacteraceae bacterium]